MMGSKMPIPEIARSLRRSRGATTAKASMLRSFSALCLLGALVVNGPLAAQTDSLRPIPQPNPSPPGTAVYKWHYTCPNSISDGTCRFSVVAAIYSANNVADAQIVLAFQTVGSQQIPFYYFWITYLGKKKPEFVMLQSNAAVSFVVQGMTLDSDTGPITPESNVVGANRVARQGHQPGDD
ncbi:MAG TPA: hypothetical protein VK603_14250 [Candidatus Saccharimonadales bacterium]|nr:hypothetical protein [Candidatus Saccharimonadales bacterium]